ncbi:MAG TPA: hypothetical protein VFJ93_02585 [Gaiellaceae bacterium]|nr:hypothetical protein [Gaiellaceae bacterium]
MPDDWVWNWTWNCSDPTSVPTPPPGAAAWIWNWQWSCPGAAPAAACTQCNVNFSVRVASPGDDGNVTQSIADISSLAVQSALDERAMSTARLAAQEAVVIAAPDVVIAAPDVPGVRTPSVVIPAPPLPPLPVTVAEPVPAIAAGTAGAVRQVASASSPRVSRAPPVFTRRRTKTVHAVARASARVLRKRGAVIVETEALVRSVVVQRSSARAGQHRGKPRTSAAHAHSALRLPRAPRAPLAPIAPSSSGAAGAAGHGDGGSPLTAALAAGVAVVGLTLLCSIIPGRVPVRRRLSDDRRARPG